MRNALLTVLAMAIGISLAGRAYAGSCSSVLSSVDDELRIGYLAEVKGMNLTGSHTIKDFDGYLRDNLGAAFTEAVRARSVAFVTIAVGDGPAALAAAKSSGLQIGELVQKRVGFHQIRWAQNSRGELGFLIYRVNGIDREIHMQSFLKWLDFPAERVRSVGHHHDWTPELQKYFAHLGPPPDLVVYGFAEAATLGILKARPVMNLPFYWRAYKALKPKKAPLTDDQSDLEGRPVHVITLRNGKRIWLFKNMYGGLAADLMKALSNYGARNFLSLGTAGSLSTRLPVGSVFSPAQWGDGQGNFEPIQVLRPLDGVPVTGNYEKVDTPNIETNQWLQDATARQLQTVEVELGYLLKWAQVNPQVKLSAALVISDILVGEDHRDMTQWGSGDLDPLRNRFTTFVAQLLGLSSDRDLGIRDYQVDIFSRAP